MTGSPRTEGWAFLLKGFISGAPLVAGSLLPGEPSQIARSFRHILLPAGDNDRPTAPATAQAPRSAASPTWRSMLRFPRESLELVREPVGDGTNSTGLTRLGREA